MGPGGPKLGPRGGPGGPGAREGGPGPGPKSFLLGPTLLFFFFEKGPVPEKKGAPTQKIPKLVDFWEAGEGASASAPEFRAEPRRNCGEPSRERPVLGKNSDFGVKMAQKVHPLPMFG